MSHLIDQRQIAEALDRAHLSYAADLNPDLAEQLSVWLNQMLDAPRNLTAIREPQQAILKHVVEPLAGRDRLISADLPVPHGPMIDIGSGNGAPGLPIALCELQRSSTLLDSRSGATDFLNQVVKLLHARQVRVHNERAEIAAHTDLRGRFSLAVGRALAAPPTALELVIPFLQTGGIAALWTGTLSDTDLEQVERTARELGAELTPIDPPHDILVATKVRATDVRYPRPWNQIRRRPLPPIPSQS